MVLFLGVSMQNKAQVESIDTLLWPKPLTHWSIAVKSGFNYMRTSPDDALKANDMFHFIYGGNVDYLFSPLIGMGLDISYNSYSRPSTLGYLNGATLDGILYGSINLANYLDPYRQGFFKKMNVYATFGPGINQFHFILNGAPKVKHTSFMAVLTLSPEYNLTKSFALLLEGQYRYYDRTNMGGPSIRKGFSDALAFNLGIRFKLNSVKGAKIHARNIDMMDWAQKTNTIKEQFQMVKDWSPEIDSLNKRLLVLENKNIDQKAVIEKKEVQKSPKISPIQVYFEFESSKLSIKGCELLDQLINQLKNSDWSELIIIGNSDYLGKDDFNMKLSFARAHSVQKYLISNGIDVSKIDLTGNGEYNPVNSEKTPEARTLNRRVKVFVIK